MLAPIYRVYEHRLLRQVRAFPVPRHIGLILDGNRRFGRLNGLHHPDDVYMAGANCMSSEHFGQLAWQFKRVSGSSGLKVQAAIAC